MLRILGESAQFVNVNNGHTPKRSSTLSLLLLVKNNAYHIQISIYSVFPTFTIDLNEFSARFFVLTPAQAITGSRMTVIRDSREEACYVIH